MKRKEGTRKRKRLEYFLECISWYDNSSVPKIKIIINYKHGVIFEKLNKFDY